MNWGVRAAEAGPSTDLEALFGRFWKASQPRFPKPRSPLWKPSLEAKSKKRRLPNQERPGATSIVGGLAVQV